MAGNIAVSHLYAALNHSWWWEGMYTGVYKYCSGFPVVPDFEATGISNNSNESCTITPQASLSLKNKRVKMTHQ